MEYIIREIKESEYPVLASFLYEAIFIPEGEDKPPKSIIEKPERSGLIFDTALSFPMYSR